MGFINSIPQSHAIVIERFGKYSRTLVTGLRITVPIIDKIKRVDTWADDANKLGYLIELAEQRTDTPPRVCHTKDNVEISINSSIYWKIVDPRKAIYEVDTLPSSLADTALNALRAMIGQVTLDQVLQERQKMNEKIYAELSEVFKGWGVKLLRTEIQELTTSDETADAMRQEMAAERQKRAKVLEAEGKKQSDILTAEGEAKAIEIIAVANARALSVVADSESNYLLKLKEQIGEKRAADVLVAEKYLKNMDKITQNSSDKVFIPNSASALMSLEASK